MNEIKILSELESSLNEQKELLIHFKNQIIKDFDSFQLPLVFSGEINLVLKELKTQVNSHINELLKNDPDRLLALLYKIDVSENLLSKTLKQYPNESYPEIVSLLIFNRELEKVILRNQFRSS